MKTQSVRYWENTERLTYLAFRASFLLAIILGLSGCVPKGGDGPLWNTYPRACEFMPTSEPICMVSASTRNGFGSQSSFRNCKQSLANYIEGINTFYKCSQSKLRRTYDELFISVPKQYDCYVDYFSKHNVGNPTSSCPLIEAPNFHGHHEARGLLHYLGTPRCVRKNGGHSFFPKHENELDICKKQVDVFLGNTLSSYLVSDFDAGDAQKQYDDYIANLKRIADQKIGDAIEKFNCLAEGGKICL
jgi:hypothetical protein